MVVWKEDVYVKKTDSTPNEYRTRNKEMNIEQGTRNNECRIWGHHFIIRDSLPVRSGGLVPCSIFIRGFEG